MDVSQLRQAFVRVTCLLLLLAVQSAAAVQTSVTFESRTYDRDDGSGWPISNASSSASSSNFIGSAQAFANTSNLAALRFSGSASMAVTSGTGYSSSSSGGGILDYWRFTNAGLDGRAGIARANIFISGSWAASGDNSEIVTNVTFSLPPYQYLFDYTGVLGAGLNQPSVEGCSNPLPHPTSCFGLFTFDIPFVFGSRFATWYRATGLASAISVTAAGVPETVSYDRTIYWGGISSVTVGDQVVKEYGFSSDSRVDWTVSAIPVPEPSSYALMLIGFGLVGYLERSRKRT